MQPQNPHLGLQRTLVDFHTREKTRRKAGREPEMGPAKPHRAEGNLRLFPTCRSAPCGLASSQVKQAVSW